MTSQLSQEAALLASFGRWVRERRRQLALSQDELAYKCGLHRTYVGGVERGERNPSLINICKIAAVLGWGSPVVDIVRRVQAEGGVFGIVESVLDGLGEDGRHVFWLTTPDLARVVYVSQSYASVWGCEPETLYANPRAWMDSITAEDLPLVQKELIAGRQSGRIHVQYRIVRRDGAVRWIRDRGFLLRGDNRAPLVMCGCAQDVTQEMFALAQLRLSEEKFRAVVETASEAIVLADSTGRITYLNKAAERLFGYRTTEVIGKEILVLMPERYHMRHQQGFQRFLETGEGTVIGKVVRGAGKTREGVEFPVELSITSYRAGDKPCFTAVIREFFQSIRALE
jgi:PAS domain S-box-containing protein